MSPIAPLQKRVSIGRGSDYGTPPAVEGSVAGWSGDQEVWVEGQGRRARSQKFNRIDVGRFSFWKELEAQE